MKYLVAIIALAASLPVQVMAQTPELDPGLGKLHHPVSTKNHEAQQYFDQGLKYVYAFNHEAAVSSFRQATTLDPDLAIGYWGAALAMGPNINMDVDPDHEKAAYESEQAALAHADHASAEERDLINALSKRYSNDPKADLHKLSEDYSAAMGELAKKYPDDLDVATLYAESLMDLHPWKFWTHDGVPTEGTDEIVKTLQGVLKRNPNHLGANHYLIHAVEASSHPELGLASARRLMTLAPSAGHLVHMPAHILQRTGDYTGAAKANAQAADVDRDFIKKHGGDSMYAAMYYNHNLQFGSASYAMIGDYATSKKMADEFAGNVIPMVKMMPVEAFAIGPMLVQVRFAKWRDVLKVPDPNVGPISTALWHFGRGTAFAKLGNVAGAESEQKVLDAALPSITTEPGFTQNSQRDLVTVASHLLAGRIASAKGDHAGAIAHYEEAVKAEDALNYDEPADWPLPSRETLGAELLRAGRPADAKRVFMEDLKHNRHNPRSLFGLGKKSSAWKGGRLRIEDL
jgi:tetratricopeptide (TPR) repeat protein